MDTPVPELIHVFGLDKSRVGCNSRVGRNSRVGQPVFRPAEPLSEVPGPETICISQSSTVDLRTISYCPRALALSL